MKSQKAPYPLNVWAALGILYVVWGSTYLAIRFAVESIPPFLMAGTRFVTAGLLLYAWARLRGAPRPTLAHWKSAGVIGLFLLVLSNGGVCWAEQKVASGVASLLVATVPLWMAILQWSWKAEAKPGGKAWLGIGLGLAGLAVLVFSRGGVGAGAVDPWNALLLAGASLCWSVGSLYARSAVLPDSAFLATSMEMLAGGAMQWGVGLLLGEASRFHPAAVTTQSLQSLVYLTLVGSLLGFTSFIWVLQKSNPTLASTYAFVNPVIAVFLGCFWGGETLSGPVFLAASLIVAAVTLIILSSGPGKGRAASRS